MKTPSFGEMIALYKEFAALERLKYGVPGETRVLNVTCGVARFCAIAGIGMSEPLGAASKRRIEDFMLRARAAGLAPDSIKTYVEHLRALTAKWTREYGAERGFDIPAIAIPIFRARPRRYARPGAETLALVKKWYLHLETLSDRRYWLAATLMLEFAMRNGDVARLEWDDFLETRGGPVLRYVPHKTEKSSGRTVTWPVHEEIWAKMAPLKAESLARAQSHLRGKVLPGAEKIFAALNASLRKAGIFRGAKGMYELRKICIDHVYQKCGAEAASAISGDDIRTVIRHYADPSAAAEGGFRIVELL